ncbi:hypothetical protein P6709_17570 [Jeotgalibacillus sp. ET6]|uniref:hypothetical protein n=1 Tax=Jeotgalibacillus sp. ET6 TaxID=3037260 RepID=UPI002418B07A|nr:hypothetical protein [Jeotgalibacillus sp. ET6]MDG5473552.1 hypothetical protein [Jeotgalibacillus sp. ET6]
MQITSTNKDFSVLIGITVAVGILAYAFIRHDTVFYLMITAIFVEGYINEQDRKQNYWKYTLSFVLLIIFLYVLLNWQI